MPNIASLLKDEITRLARKEIRAAVEPMRKQLAAQRRDIAALKRERDHLKRNVSAIAKKAAKAPSVNPGDEGDDKRPRFSAPRLASLRQKLGLSAEGLAKLIGVSGQSVYNWEGGKSRPRLAQLQQIARLRTIGKREAQRILEAAAGDGNKGKAKSTATAKAKAKAKGKGKGKGKAK